jgi:hypothetical protein
VCGAGAEGGESKRSYAVARDLRIRFLKALPSIIPKEYDKKSDFSFLFESEKWVQTVRLSEGIDLK